MARVVAFIALTSHDKCDKMSLTGLAFAGRRTGMLRHPRLLFCRSFSKN